MSSFKKLNTRIYQKSGPVITPDYVYWKKLGAPVLVKEFGPIDYIDFSPIEPYYFAVTCSVRVQVYNPITKLVVKNLSRFRENAYGAVFRSDGQLLCAGGEETNVKLFDISTKSLLRLFKGHEAPVHRTFFVSDKPQIASFSDDKTMKIWDIPTEKNIITYSEHTDYVRAGATSPSVPDIILSGGYDNMVKMYDTRTEKLVLSVNHGSPIESLLFLPSGGIFLSAGGTDIKIWDTIAGGKLLGSLSHHHKTITCLRLASNNKRLLSGSLDKHVNIYDIGTFKVVHTLDYPNAVVSLGVSNNDDTVAAGLSNGLVAISRRQEEIETKKVDKKTTSFRYKSIAHTPTVDLVVSQVQLDKESKYDRHLRKFEYSKALDSVMVPYVINKTPEVTVTLLQELIRRRGLHKAFDGRDSKSVAQILKFFIKYFCDSRFTRVLNDAITIFLDVYWDKIATMSSEVNNLLKNLLKALNDEIETISELETIEGAMVMLLSAASCSQQTPPTSKKINLTASSAAQANLVLEIN